MIGLHKGLHDVNSFGDMTHIGGSGDTYMDLRRQLIKVLLISMGTLMRHGIENSSQLKILKC